MKRLLTGSLLALLLFSTTILPVLARSTIPQVIEVEDAQVESAQNNQVDLNTFIAGGDNNGVVEATLTGAYQNMLGGKPVSDGAGGITYTGGAVDNFSNLIAKLYANPPASTETYIADLLHSAHIVQPAYAQGLGFASLTPILPAWKTFRNISYFFFVIIAIVIGLMIMLRQKMGSAAVTAQQALPKIVVAMLAVTFSYAVAGLLIDIMYIAMFFLAGLFNATDLATGNIFDLMGRLIKSGAGSGAAVGYQIVSELVDDLMNQTIEVAAGVIGGLTAAIIIAIAMLFATFKLFFELLKSYITIVISIVMSPLLLMTEAIPGRSVFRSWIKSLVANLAAFPTVLVVMIMHKVLVGSMTESSAGFMPPYLIGSTGDISGIVPGIIGLGLLLGLPEAVSKVKKALGASEGPFGDILKAGFERAKQHRGVGMATGKALTGAGLGTVGGSLYGTYRAATRGGTMRERLGRIGEGAWKGAAVGGIAGITLPPIASRTPRMVKGVATDLVEGFSKAAITGSIEQYQSRRAAERKRRKSERGTVSNVIPD